MKKNIIFYLFFFTFLLASIQAEEDWKLRLIEAALKKDREQIQLLLSQHQNEVWDFFQQKLKVEYLLESPEKQKELQPLLKFLTSELDFFSKTSSKNLNQGRYWQEQLATITY